MSERRSRMPRPLAVSEVLGTMLRGTPAEKRLREGGIWLVWEDAVGSRIAAHAAPVSFRDGTLTLAVDSGPWLQQLSLLRNELISKINGKLGEEMVKDLYLKGGTMPGPARKPARPKVHKLSELELAAIAEDAAAVGDPDLRASLERLMAKARSRG